MKKNRTRTLFIVLLSATALLGVAVTVIIGLGHNWYLGLGVAFLTFVSLEILLALYIVSTKFSKLVTLLRKQEAALDEMTRSMQQSAPLIKKLHDVNVDAQGRLVTAALITEAAESAAQDREEIQQAVEQNQKDPAQALRQMVAETRIIRMQVRSLAERAE